MMQPYLGAAHDRPGDDATAWHRMVGGAILRHNYTWHLPTFPPLSPFLLPPQQAPQELSVVSEKILDVIIMIQNRRQSQIGLVLYILHNSSSSSIVNIVAAAVAAVWLIL